MTRAELKAAILAGRATPDVDQQLFLEVLAECRREAGSNPQLVDLVESASGRRLPVASGGMTSAHARMYAALTGERVPITATGPAAAPDTSTLLAEAGERFRRDQSPAAVSARAANRDHRGYARPRAFTLGRPTIQEALADAERVPEGLHQVIADRLGGR